MVLGALGGLNCSPSGTLGIVCRKTDSPGDLFLFGCSHVLARSGQFGIPFQDVPDFQRVAQQPVASPCDATSNRIGLLQPDFSTIVARDDGTNSADFALVLIDPAIAAETTSLQAATQNSIVGVAQDHPSAWQPGTRTRLLGAMSVGVFGEIIEYLDDKAITINYPGVGDASFTGVVRYKTECQGGDSGAAVIDDENRLLGIHIGGDSSSGVGLFLPVLDYFTNHNLVLV